MSDAPSPSSVTPAEPLLPPIRFAERFDELWQQNIVTPPRTYTAKQDRFLSIMIPVAVVSSILIGIAIATAAKDAFVGVAPAIVSLFASFILLGKWGDGALNGNALPRPNEPAEHFRAANAVTIERLKKEIAAFEAGLPHLEVLRVVSDRYEECLQRCRERHARLSSEAEDLLRGLRIANATAEAHARLDKLRRCLPDLIDGTDTGRFTQDMTPFVALLEAHERIEDRSLAVAEGASEEASDAELNPE